MNISVLFSEKSRMYHTRKTWIEGDAVEQFRNVLNLPGILRGVAMPAEETLFSLAHGAGRKWTRQSTHARISERFAEQELLKTKIGSRVVCPDKNLLYEEAPEAYKNIDQVINDMREFGLIRIIARFRPLMNCKP